MNVLSVPVYLVGTAEKLFGGAETCRMDGERFRRRAFRDAWAKVDWGGSLQVVLFLFL